MIFLTNEIKVHIPIMFFSVGSTIKTLTDTITNLWETLRELVNSEKVIRYYEDAVNDKEGSHPENMLDKEVITGKLAFHIYEKYCSYTGSEYHLDQVFSFMLDIEDYYLKLGKTLTEAFNEGVIELPFEKDHKFYLEKLMKLNGDPQSLFGKFAFLQTGFFFYKNLLNKQILTIDDVTAILRVDREMAFLREEVATIAASYASNIEALRRSLKKITIAPIESEETIEEIKGVLLGYKRKNVTFRSRDSFCQQIEADKAIRSRENPTKPITSRTVWNYLRRMGITTNKEFQDYYSSLQAS